MKMSSEWLLKSTKEREMRDSLYQELFNSIQKAGQCCTFNGFVFYDLETDFYDDSQFTDQQFTFGAHKMKAHFQTNVAGVCKTYIDAKFSISDKYDWRKEGAQTKLPIPFLGISDNPLFGTLYILTTWADEMVDAGRAQEFDIYLEWSEKSEKQW